MLMEFLFEIIAVGVFSCVVFDLWQRVFKLLTGIPPSNWAMVGRWLLNLIKNQQVFVNNITAIKSYESELPIGWIFHYFVAILYAVVYFLLMEIKMLNPGFSDGLIFGIISVIVPWFFFQPALGNGLLASKTPEPLKVCMLALMMHTIFGIAIGIGFQFLMNQ
jgi:hypothetical protein